MVNNSFVELSSPCFHPAQSKADLVRVRLTRAHIASGQVGPLVDQLMQLSDTLPSVQRWNRLRVSHAWAARIDNAARGG